MEDGAVDATDLDRAKREAFLAILDEEETRLTTDPTLIEGIRLEVGDPETGDVRTR